MRQNCPRLLWKVESSQANDRIGCGTSEQGFSIAQFWPLGERPRIVQNTDGRVHRSTVQTGFIVVKE